MLMIVVVGFGMALLSRSQRTAVDRAVSAEKAERDARRRCETTLASIGDAVIAVERPRVFSLNVARKRLCPPSSLSSSDSSAAFGAHGTPRVHQHDGLAFVPPCGSGRQPLHHCLVRANEDLSQFAFAASHDLQACP